MTCKELGGACELEFEAATFEEIAKMSQQHGKEMFARQDQAHMDAMQKVMKMMQNPEEMQAWMATKMKMFNER